MRSQAYMEIASSEGKTKKEHFTKCKTNPFVKEQKVQIPCIIKQL